MSNTISEVVPMILAHAVLNLRESCVMPRLVMSDYSPSPAQKGDTVDVPIPGAVSSRAVTAGQYGTNFDVAPTKVPISLNQWREAGFTLSDKEFAEVFEGIFPMQAQEAIRALANYVDQYLLGLYTGAYAYGGTAGTTPFGTAANYVAYKQARLLLNKMAAPMADRYVVLDEDAEANALGLTAFRDAEKAGGTGVIVEGQIGRKLGATWLLSQNVQTHTAGSLETTCKVKSTGTAGNYSLHVYLASTTNSGNFTVGDVFTVAGHTQQYVVASAATIATGSATLSIKPSLQTTMTADAILTLVGKGTSYPVNLVFQKGAIAFATRPLADYNLPGQVSQSVVDPVSGVVLRLEITREHKQTTWAFDILFGASLVRPELIARLHG